MVNNTGLFAPGDVAGTETRDFDRIFEVNVKGTFFLVQKLTPHLNDNGRVINISSTAARIGESDFVSYSMSKSAIESFTKSLAKELGPRSITVNAIAPGWIETDLNRDYWKQNPEVPKAAASRTALKRVGDPSDVAGVASFLASEHAKFVTANIIEASGGYFI